MKQRTVSSLDVPCIAISSFNRSIICVTGVNDHSLTGVRIKALHKQVRDNYGQLMTDYNKSTFKFTQYEE